MLIDLAPILNDFVIPTLVPSVAVVGGWVVKKITSLLNIKLDDAQRGVVNRGLEMSISYAVSKLQSMTKDKLSVDIKSATVALAASYAVAHIPDALKYFNIDATKLANMLEARLGDHPALAAPAAAPAAPAA